MQKNLFQIQSVNLIAANWGFVLHVFLKLGSHLLVNDVKSESVSSPLHLGDQVSNLLLGLDLLLEVLALDEVSQLGVSMGVSNFVHLKQRLKAKIDPHITIKY